MPTSYTVTWMADSDANSPEEAARQALADILDPDMGARVFVVTHALGESFIGETVDLGEPIREVVAVWACR